MEEMMQLFTEIRDGIRGMNEKMEQLIEAVEETKENGQLSALTDIYETLDQIHQTLESIKGNGIQGSLSEVCYQLDEVINELRLIEVNMNVG